VGSTAAARPTERADPEHEDVETWGQQPSRTVRVLTGVLAFPVQRFVDVTASQRSLSLFRIALYSVVLFETWSIPLTYDEHTIDVLRQRPWVRTGSLTWTGDGPISWTPAAGGSPDRPWP